MKETDSKPVILIVDDMPINLQVLAGSLKSEYHVKVATSGEKAMQITKSETIPDLILLDIMMPEMDGYEVCRRLKADESTMDIPVIFVTAKTEVEDESKGFALGAVDYILKPFNSAIVKARVKTHLALRQMREDLKAKNIILERQMKEIEEKTEQLRQNDLKLIEMDRIAGIATLAAGVAHEINNPMAFVKSSISFVEKTVNKTVKIAKFWDEESVPEPLMKKYKDFLAEMNFDYSVKSMEEKFVRIKKGIDRIMQIVINLKSFSRVDMGEIGQIDIKKSIGEAIAVLGSKKLESVELVTNLQEVPLMETSANEIHQALLHTIQNAIDAVENEGIINISSSYNEKDDRIIITINDNGKGMSPEVLRQALNPFFTTKPVGSGTGVGLTIAEKIVCRHGGNIDLSSTEDVGSTVTMTFPKISKVLMEKK